MAWPRLFLAFAVLAAGCVTPAATDGGILPPAPALASTLEHHGCSLQIAFFGLDPATVQERLPEGFTPLMQQDALGRESARTFVVAYGCDKVVVDGNESGAAAEMGWALGVIPPADLAGDSKTHWIVTGWLSSSAEAAAVYEAWGLGGAGDVTRQSTGTGASGQHVTRAEANDHSYSFTSRNTAGFAPLEEDTLRLFSTAGGIVTGIVDLVVVPTAGGVGVAEYTSDDDSIYPATMLRDQGFHESFPDRAWTFTRIALPTMV